MRNGVCDYSEVGMNPSFVGGLLLLEYDQTQIADMVLLHRQSSSISCLQKSTNKVPEHNPSRTHMGNLSMGDTIKGMTYLQMLMF